MTIYIFAAYLSQVKYLISIIDLQTFFENILTAYINLLFLGNFNLQLCQA